jgi:hypothetical protein
MATITQENKASSTLTQENRTSAASLTQDNKSSPVLTQENRTAVGTLTQDSKTTSGYLWSSTIFPWQLDFPWLWENNGSLLTLETRT